MPKFIKNSESFVLLDIDQGKRYVGKKSSQKQKSQEGNSCWYYSFLNLRPRLGKNIDSIDANTNDKDATELKKLRAIEKLISNYKKEIFKYELPDNVDGIADTTIDKVKLFVKSPQMANAPIDFKQFLEKFVNQSEYPTIKTFIKGLENKRVAAQKKLLNNLGIDIKAAIDKLKNLYGNNPNSNPEVTFLSIVVRDAIANAYNLKHSAWKPDQGIKGLLDALRTEGSLSIAGRFGNYFYTKPASRLEEKSIEAYDVYGWRPGEFDQECLKNSNLTMSHVITIIGAEIRQGKGFVYYVDPMDASEPGNKRRIYKISFERLLTNINNLNNASGTDPRITDLEKSRLTVMQKGLVDGPFAFFGSNDQNIYEEQYQSVMNSKKV